MPNHFAQSILLILALLPSIVIGDEGQKAPQAEASPTSPADRGERRDREYLVGVHYFAGWWQGAGSKWVTRGNDWRDEYPHRLPLLGQYNDQATMDKEIVAAAEYGVDFFQILWYYPGKDSQHVTSPYTEQLNRGVECFRQSDEAHRLKFTMVHTNHPPFQIRDDAEWQKACRYWCDVMKHPSYLRIGGRPVFKVHSLHHCLEVCDWDRKRLAERIHTLRTIARESGLENPIVGGGASALGIPPADAVASAPSHPG